MFYAIHSTLNGIIPLLAVKLKGLMVNSYGKIFSFISAGPTNHSFGLS